MKSLRRRLIALLAAALLVPACRRPHSCPAPPAPLLPADFHLLGPDDASLLVPVVPTFSWTASANAATYEVQVSIDSAFSSFVVQETGLSVTSFSPLSALGYLTKYYWRVLATNAVGQTAPLEGFWSFTTIPSPPPAPPAGPAIAFLADKNVDGIDELFVTDYAGTTLSNLSGPLVLGGTVRAFVWSPDRSRIAFLADKEVLNVQQIWVTDLAGNPPLKVSGAVDAGSFSLTGIQWSPDGTKIAFLGGIHYGGTGTQRLSIVDSDGNNLISLPAALPAGAQQWTFRWAPDGSRIAYQADQGLGTALELYTIQPDGTGDVKVSGSVAAGTGMVDANFAWAPDGSRIAYQADANVHAQVELFTTLPTGPGSVLNVSPSVTPTSGSVNSFQWSPDGSWICYRSTRSDLLHWDLTTAHPDGSGRTQINLGDSDGRVAPDAFLWSPDSSRIAFWSWLDASAIYVRLSIVSPDAGGYVEVNPHISVGELNYSRFLWAPDGSRLGYLSDSIAEHLVDLYTCLPDGSGIVQLTATAGGSEGVLDFRWAPDSHRISLVAAPGSLSRLFVTYPYGGPSLSVSGPGSSSLSLRRHEWSPDGSYLSYIGITAGTGEEDLYAAVPTASSGHLVSGPLVTGGNVRTFENR